QCTILEKHYNDLQLKFQRYKENLKNLRVLDNSNDMASNAIFEITLLKDQVWERDETVRNLQSEINISKMLNLGGNDDSTASSVNVQALETDPKYIVPHRRDNRETPIPVPKKKHVTFREPQSTTRITSKPDTAIKQPNVSVPLFTRVKPASRASKPGPKSNAWIYRRLSARSGRGKKVAAHLRTLNKQNHAKSSVSTTKTVRKPNVVTPKKPMWKPTGRHFTLYASSPLTRTLEPIDEPVELTPSVSSNANLTIESSPISLVVQIVLWYLDSGCSKHMTGDRKRLINFVEKFIGTVRFRNDQVAKIVGYGDYQIGETIILRVY
nr:hypothetical protein [Tanacetum cinerariifolium]